MAKDRKPKRRPKHSYVCQLPNGVELRIQFVLGLRYYFCPRFPQIAEKHNGAGDGEADAAYDEFYRLALGLSEPSDQQKASA